MRGVLGDRRAERAARQEPDEDAEVLDLGISFSMPIEAMWSFGRLAERSALPSLVQTTKAPVSATAKLAPVMPASAVRK